MLTSSPAIKKAKTTTLYIKVNGPTVVIADRKTKQGKWHVIDIAFGDTNSVLGDLRAQGYDLKRMV